MRILITSIIISGKEEAADEVTNEDKVAKDSPNEMEDDENEEDAAFDEEEDPSDAELDTEGNVDSLQLFLFTIDPFTVDRTGDSNGVVETMRREILDFRIFWLSSHIARFPCINVLEPDENVTGPT